MRGAGISRLWAGVAAVFATFAIAFLWAAAQPTSPDRIGYGIGAIVAGGLALTFAVAAGFEAVTNR